MTASKSHPQAEDVVIQNYARRLSEALRRIDELQEQLEAAQKALREIDDLPVEESARNGWTRHMQNIAHGARS